ncbi:MAG TPA: hypothetical protein VK601_00275, partial [Kofleriaceae bacterium]|nr:hypothetical protein [Kofleriaceae bacterium]
PIEVPGLNDPTGDDVHATLSDDERTVYFGSSRNSPAGAAPIYHIYFATRTTRDGVFGKVDPVGPTFSTEGETNPSISRDGNTLYFDSFRGQGVHLWTSTRSNPGIAFSMPAMITADPLVAPSVTDDGKVLYVANLSFGSLSRLAFAGGAFGNPETVAVPGGLSITTPVTRDELTLYLSIGDTTGHEIQVTKRASLTSPWPMPSEVTELKINADSDNAEPSWISADGCRIYLRYRLGSEKSKIYLATRPK